MAGFFTLRVFARNLLRANTRRNSFCIFFLCLAGGYLLDYGLKIVEIFAFASFQDILKALLLTALNTELHNSLCWSSYLNQMDGNQAVEYRQSPENYLRLLDCRDEYSNHSLYHINTTSISSSLSFSLSLSLSLSF